MLIAVTRSLFSFFIPGGLLFLSAVAFVYLDGLSAWPAKIVTIYPLLVAGLAIIFGWRFNRSRLVFTVLVLLVADRALIYGQSLSSVAQSSFFCIVSILLPINLVILALLKERGILSRAGIFRLAFIFMQPVGVGLLYYRTDILAHLPQIRFLPWLPIHLLGLSQLSLISFAISFLILAFLLVRKRGAMENGFLWALISCFFALTVAPIGYLSTLSFTTAGLVLFISGVEATYFVAFRDELTGLPSRRAMNDYFLRLNKRYSVAMVDIDFFKKFNDRYGHDVGDQVLCMVAVRIAQVKGGGRAFRFGGEEFTIIFPKKSMATVLPHLEALRASIEDSGFMLRSGKRPAKKGKGTKDRSQAKKVGVTVSIGVAQHGAELTKSAAVIKAADKALYAAKKQGRNRVVGT